MPVLVQSGADQPVERTSLEAFAEQADPLRPVYLVLSSADAVMTRVSLGRKQARHLQKVLPYLLEENLLGEPEAFWFSWGRAEKTDSGDHWPVLAVKRQQLEALRHFCGERGLFLRGATTDAALLASRAPLRLADSAGVLLMPDALRALTVDADTEAAVIRAMDVDTADWTVLQGDQAAFSAFRAALAEGAGIELLRDSMRPLRHRQDVGAAPGPWRPLGWLAAATVLMACVLMGVQQWRYEQAAEQAREQAEAAYLQLFPGDRVSGGLRRQFQARLNRLSGSGGGGQGFLAIMASAGEVLSGFREQGVVSQRLRYDSRQNLLTLDLQASDFDALERLRSALGDQGLNAEIATARNEGDEVKARLKVERSG